MTRDTALSTFPPSRLPTFLLCLFFAIEVFAESATLTPRLPGARLSESLLRESRHAARQGERWLTQRNESTQKNLIIPTGDPRQITDTKKTRLVNYLRGLVKQGFFNGASKDASTVVWGWTTQLLDTLPPSLLVEAGVPTDWRAIVANHLIASQQGDGGWGSALETQWAVWTLGQLSE